MMAIKEFDELCDHIKAHGLIEPIVIHEGKILDGRNRYKACGKTGTEPKYIDWSPVDGISAVQWVIGKNMKRRHLTSEQKATAAFIAMQFLSEAAKARQVAAGSMQSGNQYTGKKMVVPQKVAEPPKPREAAEEAAVLFGTNKQYVKDAAKAHRDDPEAFKKMQRGEMTFREARERRIERSELPPPPPPERIDWKAEYWKLREQVDVIVESMDPEQLQQAIVRVEMLLKAKALPR
jgi:hypothetical protein